MNQQYKCEALAAPHKTLLRTKRAMQAFDSICLTPVE